MCFFVSLILRYSHQSVANYGQIGAGFVWTVQLSDSPRRFSWCYQQKIVARNYQGLTFTIEHHECCLHSTNTVSISHFISPFDWNRWSAFFPLHFNLRCKRIISLSILFRYLIVGMENWQNDFIWKWSSS